MPGTTSDKHAPSAAVMRSTLFCSLFSGGVKTSPTPHACSSAARSPCVRPAIKRRCTMSTQSEARVQDLGFRF